MFSIQRMQTFSKYITQFRVYFTEWVMEVAEKHKFIKGIVAGVGLTNPKLSEILDDLQKNPLLKGVRHLLEFEDDDWIARDDVHAGLKVLEDRGLSFDLAMWLKFMVNHLGIPNIKEKQMSPWKEQIEEISKTKNVYCKLSGLVTADDWNNWKVEDFKPYVDHVVSCFGIDRCMFASDWPVCTLAKASYAQVFTILNNLLPDLSDEEKLKIYRNNAKDFYRLDI
ncbi:hypothetical protein KUTeg_021708 [Tegillarca granosa]|uniref:Amidohydrolase-related domain-containing protein n=1 Tax=Tegillarca granosa TaxID=220873 RepID=A0ABQ9E4F0_TEGGR|nr:hypothetical protein KUTeg_021708 [Tegillarca granosa]